MHIRLRWYSLCTSESQLWNYLDNLLLSNINDNAGPIHMAHRLFCRAIQALQTLIQVHPMVVSMLNLPSLSLEWQFGFGVLGTGTCSGSGGSNGWFVIISIFCFVLIEANYMLVYRLCQHRWPAVVGMTGFRNNVSAASSNALTNWVSPSSQQIAFARGTSGFVAINNEDSTWKAKLSSGLPAGTYCDVVAGPPSGSICAGQM